MPGIVARAPRWCMCARMTCAVGVPDLGQPVGDGDEVHEQPANGIDGLGVVRDGRHSLRAGGGGGPPGPAPPAGGRAADPGHLRLAQAAPAPLPPAAGCVPENLPALQKIQEEVLGLRRPPQGAGGRHLEDLWGFNDPELVRASAACRLPILTGVGHEIDTTLVELASDRRAATPAKPQNWPPPSGPSSPASGGGAPRPSWPGWTGASGASRPP